jgi:hypothetical protein
MPVELVKKSALLAGPENSLHRMLRQHVASARVVRSLTLKILFVSDVELGNIAPQATQSARSVITPRAMWHQELGLRIACTAGLGRNQPTKLIAVKPAAVENFLLVVHLFARNVDKERYLRLVHLLVSVANLATSPKVQGVYLVRQASLQVLVQ